MRWTARLAGKEIEFKIVHDEEPNRALLRLN
ncbi:hypothetical protein M2263_001006 [Providencia alcalifaciens]|nr:hypothetical protein [Providencia alcalifaciens]